MNLVLHRRATTSLDIAVTSGTYVLRLSVYSCKVAQRTGIFNL